MIESYVYCEEHRCSIEEWEHYCWHADQGCHLTWGKP